MGLQVRDVQVRVMRLLQVRDVQVRVMRLLQVRQGREEGVLWRKDREEGVLRRRVLKRRVELALGRPKLPALLLNVCSQSPVPMSDSVPLLLNESFCVALK